MEGFKKETSRLHLKQLMDTSPEIECIFKGINTYKKYHGEVSNESMKRKLKYTTSIYKPTDATYVLCFLQLLRDEILNFEAFYYKK